MKKILLILLSISLFGFSQTDKRIALVIGNNNYTNIPPLKNPVNDARLMAKTLESIGFEVLLEIDITDKRSFVDIIKNFSNKRTDASVALVYYSGHGIQIDSENFLLPTQEVFESENDVTDFAISVQDVMRYICGDAKYSNSLLAFSTDAGNTAADGDGKNSIYCESLCKNMVLENISIDQLFRNVRKEMMIKTDGEQVPQDRNLLTGDSYYLSKSNSDKVNIFIVDAGRDNPFRSFKRR